MPKAEDQRPLRLSVPPSRAAWFFQITPYNIYVIPRITNVKGKRVSFEKKIKSTEEGSRPEEARR
jgi:hypothetical protein